MELEDLTALVRRAGGARVELTSEERDRIYARALQLGTGARSAGGSHGGHRVAHRWRRIPTIAGALAITAGVIIALVVPSSGHPNTVSPRPSHRHGGVTVSKGFSCPATRPDSPVVAYATYQLETDGPTYVAAVSLPSATIRWTTKVPHDWPVDAIAAAPDGKTVYAVVGYLRSRTKLLSIAASSGRVARTIALPGPPPSQAGLAISPNGREALVAETGGIWTGAGPIGDGVTLVDLVNGTVRTVAKVGNVIGVGFSPDSETAYVSGDGVTVLDASTGRVTGHVAFPSTQAGIVGTVIPGALAVSPTGTFALVANAGLDLTTPEGALNVVNLRALSLDGPIKLPKSDGSYNAPVVVACNGSSAFDLVYGVGVVRIDPATHQLRKVTLHDTDVDAVAETTGGGNIWVAAARAPGCVGACPAVPPQTWFFPLDPRSNRAGSPTKALPWSIELMTLGRSLTAGS